MKLSEMSHRPRSFLAKMAEGSIAPVEVASEEELQSLNKIRTEQLSGLWPISDHIANEAFGFTNPRNVPAEIVQSFLAQHSEGSTPDIEMASDDDVQKLTALIRSGRGWTSFVAKNAYGIRDPKRLPAEAAQRFLSEFQPQPKGEKRRSRKRTKGKKTEGKQPEAPQIQLSSSPKQDLHNWVQQMLGRNLETADVIYSFDSDTPPFKATVTLPTALLNGGIPGKM